MSNNRPRGHDQWTVWDPERENAFHFDSRADADEKKAEAEGLGIDAELYPPGESPEALFYGEGDPDVDATPTHETDGGQPAEVVDAEAETVATADDVDLENRDVTKDPMQWMPSHFIDEIQGVPAINRKGYAVLAQHCNISVRAEPVTRPAETDFEYAEFQAVAETPAGTEYTGYGSAHVDRDDDATLLAELAETRAMKRATAWATGVGMTAVEEMEGHDA